MYIKKVYLAKSNLASGFDVEYVKSNLSRIPNLQILEYGSGTPEEADCVVIINDSSEKNLNQEIFVNKNISKILLSYLNNNFNDNIFIYNGFKNSERLDVEKTTPLCKKFESIDLNDENDTEVQKERDWQKHSLITLSNNSYNLLESVCFCLDINKTSWLKNTRHYKQEDKYALPPIPSLDARKSNKRLRTTFNIKNELENSFNISKGNNISLRRKRRNF